ncbi:uncharacterized protein [Procambarus clarkii]|uniref:uncharacterized protein n=1 Tax=Procambarus clarkii TaxID=6728 RepID=UPI0037422379
MARRGRDWLPPAPRVEVSSSSRKSLRISWQQEDGGYDITKYSVKVTAPKKKTLKFNCPVTRDDHHGKEQVHHCELKGLSPQTHYNLTVKACVKVEGCSVPTVLLAYTAGPAIHPFLIALIVICLLLVVACFAVNYDVLQALCCPSYDRKRSVEYHSTGSTTPPSSTTPTATTSTSHHGGQQLHHYSMQSSKALTNLVRENGSSNFSGAGTPAGVPAGEALTRSTSVNDEPAIHPCVKASWSSPSAVSQAACVPNDPPDYDSVIHQAPVHKQYDLGSPCLDDPHVVGRISFH